MKPRKPLILRSFTAIMSRIQLKTQFSSLKAGIKGKVESQRKKSVLAEAHGRTRVSGARPCWAGREA